MIEKAVNSMILVVAANAPEDNIASRLGMILGDLGLTQTLPPMTRLGQIGDVSAVEIAAARHSGGSSTRDVRTASACGLDARKSKPWATGVVGRGRASGGPRERAAS